MMFHFCCCPNAVVCVPRIPKKGVGHLFLWCDLLWSCDVQSIYADVVFGIHLPYVAGFVVSKTSGETRDNMLLYLYRRLSK